MAFDFEKELKVTETNIPGLLVFDLPVHGDNRGWFKENWQRAKMMGLGLPDFGPVQNNISFNATKGVTRGIHAEPWDKYISIATGEIFPDVYLEVQHPCWSCNSNSSSANASAGVR